MLGHNEQLPSSQPLEREPVEFIDPLAEIEKEKQEKRTADNIFKLREKLNQPAAPAIPEKVVLEPVNSDLPLKEIIQNNLREIEQNKADKLRESAHEKYNPDLDVKSRQYKD